MTSIIDILGTSTPVSEFLAEKLGYVKAAIACRVFFQQQLKDGVCSASIATLAKKLGMSTGAVSKHLKWLRENDYIIVIGQHRSGNKTNKYKVGPKFYEVIEGQHSPRESKHSPRESNIHHVNGKEESKEDIKETTTCEREKENPPPTDEDGSGSYSLDSDYAEVCELYENEIGSLSGIVAGMIKDDMEAYPKQWILEAIPIAVEANSRKWSYVRGVLKNWKTKGRGRDKPGKAKRKIAFTDTRTGKQTIVEVST